MGELLARMRTALRHRVGVSEEAPLFSTGSLSVDLTRRLVSVEGDEIRLSRKEYDVLRMLVKHAGKVVTHQQLLREVWGPAHVNETQYLRVYVGQLRQKIERDPTQPRYIITEAGVGYRLRQLDDDDR
jgi:two-component system KDP operon response regulator KdpE